MSPYRKIVTYALGIILACLVFWPLAYFLVLNSERYAVAEQYVQTSPDVTTQFGNLTKVRLAPLGFVMGVGVEGETSHLDLHVTGSQNNGVVLVDLKKVNGMWKIIHAEVKIDEK